MRSIFDYFSIYMSYFDIDERFDYFSVFAAI